MKKITLDKKKKRKILIGGLILAGLGVGTYAGMKYYGNKKYLTGIEEAKTAFEDFNYKKIKSDVMDAYFRKTFDDIYTKNLKKWIEDTKSERYLNFVGGNQEKEFMEYLLKKPHLKAHASLLINAKPEDVVKSF